MSENWFSDNYRDLSVQHGVNAGFQYEFYCARCQDAYRTPFQPFKSGQASGWLGKAAGMFGGALGNAENVLSGVVDSGYANARDGAFQAAVQDATNHFHRCPHCLAHVCDKCWNAQSGLCLNCAPDAQVEIESSRARGLTDMAGQRAYTAGETMAEKLDVQTATQLVCPNCGAETKGSKFCPECGAKLAVTGACTGCGAQLAPGTKFCPDAAPSSESGAECVGRVSKLTGATLVKRPVSLRSLRSLRSTGWSSRFFGMFCLPFGRVGGF